LLQGFPDEEIHLNKQKSFYKKKEDEKVVYFSLFIFTFLPFFYEFANYSSEAFK